MKRIEELENLLSFLISVIEYGIKKECRVRWKKKITKGSIGEHIYRRKKRSKIFLKKSLLKKTKLALQTLLHEGIHHVFMLDDIKIEEDAVLTLEAKIWLLMSKKQKRELKKLLPK